MDTYAVSAQCPATKRDAYAGERQIRRVDVEYEHEVVLGQLAAIGVKAVTQALAKGGEELALRRRNGGACDIKPREIIHIVHPRSRSIVQSRARLLPSSSDAARTRLTRYRYTLNRNSTTFRSRITSGIGRSSLNSSHEARDTHHNRQRISAPEIARPGARQELPFYSSLT
jgi:hypothetical protein